MKVAIVYDRVNKWGGAERILLALHELFPEAPLFTSVYNPNTANWATIFNVMTSFLQAIPFAKSRHEYFPLLMPLAFESFSFDEYDLVISVTSEAAKGIITKTSTKHICICLTPTRYLWSGYREYFKSFLLRISVWPIVKYLRMWDKIASARPDTYIAISQEVAGRIKKNYGRESVVIYPPVSLEVKELKKPRGTMKNYFLIVSRLSKFTSYKRVDIAVRAATKLGVPLVVVGDGDASHLKKIAGPTVQFVGKVTDEELAGYYNGCRALIFPGYEDFGLVMVEAQAAGKPVIAYRGGGALEIVREGQTGVFFNRQTTDALLEVLKSFDEHVYNNQACKKNAERFTKETFQQAIRTFINKQFL